MTETNPQVAADPAATSNAAPAAADQAASATEASQASNSQDPNAQAAASQAETASAASVADKPDAAASDQKAASAAAQVETETEKLPVPELTDQPQAMMQFFAFNHLAPPMKSVSQAFHELAVQVVENIGQGPERTVALRKLLEAKDAAVRAVIYPGA